MSNVKVVKVDNLKLSGGSKKKSKKQPPKNIEYLQNIVRKTKKTSEVDLTNSQMISQLLSKKSKKNMEVRIKKKETPKNVEKPKPIVIPIEKPKPVVKPIEKPKPNVEKPKKTEISTNVLAPPVPKKQKLPKKIGKKASKKSIMSFFSKEDQKKIRNRTKRVKKIISSNPIAPKVDKKTKRNLYKIGVRNILSKDKKGKKEINKMSRDQLMKELVKNGIIEKDSNAPSKVLKDLYQLYTLVEANISKTD